MFTWEERLKLAQAFANRPNIKKICSIGSHKATFATTSGTESYDYFYLRDAIGIPEFLNQLIKKVHAWQMA